MIEYDGIYLMYEGTDAQCSGVQLSREPTWATNIGPSGALRYRDCSGIVHYIGPGLGESSSSYWLSDDGGNSIYFPTAFDIERIVDIRGTLGLSGWLCINSTNVNNNDNDELYMSPDSPLIHSGSYALWLRDRGSGVAPLLRCKSWRANSVFTIGSEWALLEEPIGGDSFETVLNYTGSIITVGSDYSSRVRIGASNISTREFLNIYAPSGISLSTSADVYTYQWSRYYPVLSGWDNFDACNEALGSNVFNFKAIGKTVYVQYAVAGYGNGDATAFELPYPANWGAAGGFIQHAGLAGYLDSQAPAYINEPIITIPSGSNVAYISTPSGCLDSGGRDPMPYGSGVYKWLCGSFWYQVN